MSLSTSNFSLQQLEARFEMQCMENDSGGRFYYNEQINGDGCGGGGGSSYGYYGSSWGNEGSGDGYVGTYQSSGDGSYAVLDDGSYTDGTSGSFPTYGNNGASSSVSYDASAGGDAVTGPSGIGFRTFCVLSRCKF